MAIKLQMENFTEVILMKFSSLALYAILAGLGLSIVATPAQAMFRQHFSNTIAASSKILSTTKEVVLAPIKHPYLMTGAGLATLALGGAYIVNCNKTAKDWSSVLEESEQITRFMVNCVGTPEKMMYWHNKLKTDGHWPTAADVIGNSTQVYTALKDTPWIWNNAKSEHDFIANAKCVIEKEKKDLMKVFAKLENCLAENNVLPSLGSYEQPAGETNIVQEIIQQKMRNFNYDVNTDFTQLTKKEAESVNRDIMKRAMPSVFNPYLSIRAYALPFETRAIREYWRVYQLLQRLEALKLVLDQKLQNPKISAQEVVLEAR